MHTHTTATIPFGSIAILLLAVLSLVFLMMI